MAAGVVDQVAGEIGGLGEGDAAPNAAPGFFELGLIEFDDGEFFERMAAVIRAIGVEAISGQERGFGPFEGRSGVPPMTSVRRIGTSAVRSA